MFKRLTDPFAFGQGQKINRYYVAGNDTSIDFFHDVKITGKDADLHLPEKKSVFDFIIKNRFRWWLVILIFSLLVLLGRFLFLQLIEGDSFRAIAEGNRVRIRTVKATRGLIYDRQQNLLVQNIPSFSLTVIPVDLSREENKFSETLNYLSKFSGKPTEELRQLIKAQPFYSYQPIVIQENLTFDQAILAKIGSYDYPGIVLRVDSARQYLNSTSTPSFSHFLGYLGKIDPDELKQHLDNGYSFDDYLGKNELELQYEDVLKGKNGNEYVEVDAFGQTEKFLAYQKPEPGKNLILTIDAELQKKAEESLRKVLQTYNKKRGAVVVLDPNSGEILALVSWPAFDNNLFSAGIKAKDFNDLINDPNQPLFNRAISGTYPSGSTFKLIMSAAALQEKVINSTTSFNSVGGIRVGSWFFPDWKVGGHGWTNVTKALAESINTFFYIIGGGYQDFKGLGVDKIKKYAELFGLNHTLGIDLPNEASGFVPDEDWKQKTKNEQWYIGDTYHLAIGQGDLSVTPLQVAAWTGVFANGGKLYQPHLVKAISDGKTTKDITPKIIRQDFIDQKNINIVNQGLRQAVLSGSAKRLLALPVSAAAKTGTAEWSSQYAPQAWFTAFAPYEKPQIVVTVLVEEGGEGSQVAMPVAFDILNWWANNLDKTKQ